MLDAELSPPCFGGGGEGEGYFPVIDLRECAGGRGRIFLTGLTVMWQNCQWSYQNRAHILEDWGKGSKFKEAGI